MNHVPQLRTLTMVFLAAIGILVSGCASIVKGTSQSVTINTDPVGALCILSRDSQQIAVVNPTPGTVQVGKGAGTISVSCKKVGYLDSVGALASTFQAMTFGNIIFGGIIGVAVDAASGAMHEYPPMVTITLMPEAFVSGAERDVFFDKMRGTLLKEAEEVRARIRDTCKPTPGPQAQASNCDAQLKAVDSATNAKLGEIEAQRANAKVRGQ